MKIIQALLTIVFVHAYMFVYKNVKKTFTRKIYKKDFLMIHHSKSYLRVMIDFDAENNIIRGNIKKDMSQSENQFSKDFFIKCVEIPDISNIALEIENHLKKTGKILKTDFIILVYNPHDYINYNFMKKLIKNIKKSNSEKNRNPTNLHYEYILERNSDFEKILSRGKFDKNHDNKEFGNFDVPICHVRRNYMNYVIFSIDIMNICYIFKINYNEIDAKSLYRSFLASKLSNNNHYKDLQRELYLLHNFINKNERNLHLQSSALKCTDSSVKFENKSFIKFYKENGKIIFTQRGGNYVYPSKKKFYQKFVIEEFIEEFRSILKKISDIQNGQDFIKVELFIKLLVKKDKIKTILNNILNKPKSAINLIFIHLLFFDRVINESELKQLRKNRSFNEKRRTISNVLKNKLSNQKELNSQPARDMLKLCIFIEADTFLNENNLKFEPPFYKLREIGKQVLKHEPKQVECNKINLLIKKKINLMRIYDKVYHHLDDIIKLNDDFAKILSEIICLFKGNNNYTYYINEVNYKGNLNEIVKLYEFNKNDIERNNKEILNKLEKYSNDEKIKKIIEIIQKSSLKEKLARIIIESKNKYQNTTIDEKEIIMSELLEKGNKEIEKTFIDKEIKKHQTIYNEDLIKKYKNELKAEFKEKIILILNENIRKTSTEQ
ncbi:uncharacterized protein VNE69_05255 [Vairimorpha necatrix]|uniref:Uncharacterized protein n=1 Tax=Vairimorpha necatrix TaxID=6039 RepID=A0AAX4JCH4_9MICR